MLVIFLWATCAATQRGVVVIRDQDGKEVALYDQSHALVIGVSDYRNGWPPLPGVKGDLQAVKAALARRGFQLKVVEDPDQATLESAYRDFILRHGRKRNNRLLFYFAGHGYTEKPSYATDDPQDWMGYIVSRDAPLPALDFPGFRRNAMSMQRFEELAKDIQSKHALFIFDSCFSGSVFSMTRGVPKNISRKTAKPVRQFITSGDADQEVPDVSEFRRQFIAALAGEGDLTGDGYVTGSELGMFLEDRVTNYSDGAQTPKYGKLRHRLLDKGEFVFLAGREPQETAKPVPSPADPLLGNVQVNVNVPVTAYIGNEKKVQLTVRSNVRGDTVYINGQARGPTGPKAHMLEAGTHTVRVEKPDYEPWEHTLVLAAGAHKTVRATLRPKSPPPASNMSMSTPPQRDRSWTEPVTGMPFAWVPGNCFEMGSRIGEVNEQPAHRVCVEGFWLGKYEVTQEQWQRVMGRNPAHFAKGGQYPVEQVSWKEVHTFIAELDRRGRGGLRLPSEAEWEYACRSGGQAETYCGGESVEHLAWYGGNSSTPQPVGRKRPNGLGLHDMSGNVWEWVQDCWHDSYAGAPEDGRARATGDCARRVARGGSWNGGQNGVRATLRDWYGAGNRFSNLGFRLAITP